MGMGMSDTFMMQPKPFDGALVPCDIVSNAILVSAYAAAKTPEPKFSLYHCSACGAATAEVYAIIEDALEYLKYNPFDAAITEKVSFNTVRTFEDWKKYRRYKYDLPEKVLQLTSKIPYVGTKKMA